jgi:ATP-dependent RNA helicase DDX46/PRP5
MFDMGFEPQIKMIIQNVRPDRQTILFSATFPKQIEKLAKTVLKLPLEIIVGERSSVNKDITQYVEVHEEEDKFLRLLQLLGVWYDKGSVLIFVDKQEKCDQLFQELLKLGYPCLSLHGGKDQVDRDHTLHEFKTGIKTVMVATSVAGRGLDVPEIVCVINYNCPNHLEDYVHRVGRTGRAGRKGTAYTFVSSKEEQYAPSMMKALQKAGRPVPEELSKLVEAFKEKVERGEAQYSANGFSGKGFTFDASEMNEAQRIAIIQKKAYELEQGLIPDKVVEGEEGDDEFDEAFGEEQSANQSTTSAAAIATTSTAAMAPLDRARALAAGTTVGGALPSDSSSSSSAAPIDPKLALARAKIIAQQLLSRRSTGDSNAPEFFVEELDINDYPPQVTMVTFAFLLQSANLCCCHD